MAISIELSVEPHYKNTHYTKESMLSGGPWVQTPDSHPPHVIVERTFNTWAEAKAWLDLLDLKTDSGCLEDFLHSLIHSNPENVYVGEEIELLERTGHEYTCACLAIEGDEEGRPQRDRPVPDAS